MEIEIKAKIRSVKMMRKRLIALEARPVKKVHQIDWYYSLYKRPLTKRIGSIVRVRQNGIRGLASFEFHSATNFISAEENEVSVSDLKTLKRILKKMKAREEVVVDKHREYFKKGILEIVLDRVKGLGSFIEVEIQGRDTKLNRQRIINFLRHLQIDKKQFVLNEKYNTMLLKKKGKKYAYF